MKKYTLCECFETHGKRLDEAYGNNGYRIVKGFQPVHKSFLIGADDGSVGTGISIPFEAEIKEGRRTRTITTNMILSVCPFCQKPMVVEEDQNKEDSTP